MVSFLPLSCLQDAKLWSNMFCRSAKLKLDESLSKRIDKHERKTQKATFPML